MTPDDAPQSLFLTSLAACGLIFGDIGKLQIAPHFFECVANDDLLGTSPLYALNAIFPAENLQAPTDEDVIGAISAIIWALFLVGIVKTAIIALQFGSPSGEGGPVVLYTTLFPQNQTFVSRPWMKTLIIGITLFAAALMIADGLLAPAVSVVSAVGGLTVHIPLTIAEIKGIAVAILAVLFCIQRLGVARLTHVFTPVIIIWLAFIFSIGIYNIVQYPLIFRAFDPSRAVLWFVRSGSISHLSGVLLCITGVESLFASMGQFDKASIRLGFMALVYPALTINYLGQGAALHQDGNVIRNVFYHSIPVTNGNALFWVVWVVSLAATVVASQGIITATFSLIQHLMGLRSFPPVHTVHTSESKRVQIYIPVVNFLLMAGTLAVVGGFGSRQEIRGFGTDPALTNAYGLCVSGTLFCTTLLLSLVMFYVRGWNVFIAVGFFLLSGFIDALFFSSSLQKVPHGAWFTLVLSVVLGAFLCFWTWAKNLEDRFDAEHRLFLNDVFKHYIPSESESDSDASHSPVWEEKSPPLADIREHEELVEQPAQLRVIHSHDDEEPQDNLLRVPSNNLESILSRTTTQLHDGRRVKLMVDDGPTRGLSLQDGNGKPLKLPRVTMFSFFHHFGSGIGAPHSFTALTRRILVLPRIVVFLSIRRQHVPYVDESDKILLNKLKGLDGFYMMTLRLGYRDNIDLRGLEKPTLQRILRIESGGMTTLGHGEKWHARVKSLEEAADHCTHIMPTYNPVQSKGVPYKNPILQWSLGGIRRFLLEYAYRGASQLFPESSQYFMNESQILRVGIGAKI